MVRLEIAPTDYHVQAYMDPKAAGRDLMTCDLRHQSDTVVAEGIGCAAAVDVIVSHQSTAADEELRTEVRKAVRDVAAVASSLSNLQLIRGPADGRPC